MNQVKVETAESVEVKSKDKGKIFKIIGYSLIALSGIAFFAMLLVPLFPFETKTKAILAGVLLVIMEASFWLAIPFLGKEIVNAIKKYLNPVNWFRKKKV